MSTSVWCWDERSVENRHEERHFERYSSLKSVQDSLKYTYIIAI